MLYGEVQAIKNEYKQNLYRVETAGEPPTDLPDRFAVVKAEKNALTFKLDDEAQSNDLLKLLSLIHI